MIRDPLSRESVRPLCKEDLSLEQKTGQMLLARHPRNAEEKAFILDRVRHCALGGIHTADTELVEELRAIATYPLLICENMEHGYAKAEDLPLPSPMTIGASGREDLAYEFGRLTALGARRDGYNLVFGPIFDLAIHPAACCVGPRAFGADHELVARMGAAAVRGYQEQGLIVTAKHYPGFGASPVDSHLGMVYLDADEDQLRARELYPYLHTMAGPGLSGVMTGHIMVPAIDPDLPASLSPALIGLLRASGFDGLVMTDSLAMVGLTNRFGLEACHVMAMQAGNDMVMTSYRLSPRDGYGWMLRAVQDGRVDPALVEQAVRRVLAAQAQTLCPAVPVGPLSERERALPLEMAQAGVCVSNPDSFVPLDPGQKHLFLVMAANHFTDPRTNLPDADVPVMDTVAVTGWIRERFPEADVWPINEYPGRAAMEAACSATMAYESVVLMAFTRTEHYAGSSDFTRRMLALLDGLGSKLSAVVVRGNPYAARELGPEVPVVFAFDGRYSETVALDVLAGRARAHGRLPVPVRRVRSA